VAGLAGIPNWGTASISPAPLDKPWENAWAGAIVGSLLGGFVGYSLWRGPRGERLLCVVLLLLTTGFTVACALRVPPTMWSKFDRLREGMTYDQVIEVLGKPTGQHISQMHAWRWGLFQDPRHLGVEFVAYWDTSDGRFWVLFNPDDRACSLEAPTRPPGLLDRVRSRLGL
jgi:hypothetical protein